MRHRGGEDVALGLYHYYENRSAKDDENNRQEQELSYLLRATNLQHLVPRESAVLCRALIRHVLSSINSTTIDPRVPWRHSWIEIACQPVLAASRDICDAVVRLMVLSQSSVLKDDDSNRLLCHALASLLGHTIQVDGDDESDLSDSEEAEDGCTVRVADRFLRRYLTEVATTWSETVFIRPQTDQKIQRHFTFFLLSALLLLTGKEENPSSNVVAVILEGVTERLNSPIDRIRKVGMHVGETLAVRLGQELKFEELNDERLGDRLEREVSTQIEPEKNQQTPRLVRSAIVKTRLKRFSGLYPDAEYVSEEGGESDEQEDFDDDSVWDDSSAVAAYDLRDDEEDLRETPVPL